MSSPVRTAVLGYGLAGRIFHSPFVAAVPGLELAAIVTSSSTPARSPAAAAQDYPTARILAQPEQAFAEPEIDLIVVATPNDTHFDLAAAALRAGKHVVVDKPLATSSAQARELISLAQQHGRVLAPFHNRRFDADFLTLRKLTADATLGRIVQVRSHMDRYRPVPRPNTWKEHGPGNGLLFDLGPHLVDQAIALFGAPTAITASIRHIRDRTDIEDAIDLTLHYSLPTPTGDPRPLRYECSATMLAAAPSPRLRVHGTLGSYLKQGMDPQEAALLAGARPPQLGSAQPWLPEPDSAWGTLTLATQQAEPVQLASAPLPSVPGDYRLFYASVRDAITTGSPLAVPAEDAFRTLRTLELAQLSSDQLRTIPADFT